ncbi:YciI family protein [Pedobacter nyackensis]|uniref:Uncharacterized conserved protein YciI, contains a putative active-site phosphohistidine n=1 Tax=Pedobacter nyackensis TaxID=475255 RepID=A0A1W2F552_9SPHI|nr:YciI family protein [Pedobacter nyackensis]SMD16646.1 Uncharacterized conserved protein YciI, contains a putative active-site phosphohistidine [Pedobacter nyackensis]
MYRKHIVIAGLLFLSGFSALAQADNPKYDKKLADSLQSDDYGMKIYYLVILKTGTNTTESKAKTDSLFSGHMGNIGRLVSAGKLVVAGPFQKNDKSYRGIFILNAASSTEAKALLETDPAIKHKLLEAEVYGWYGSAALPMYLPYHDKLEKKKM